MDDDRRSYTSAGSDSNKSAISVPSTFSNAKPRNIDPIRIECKKIEIKPTGAYLDTYTDVKLRVLFRHSTRDLCLCLNELKDKVCIPYDQVTGFRIAEYKELEVSLVPNFKRKFYQVLQKEIPKGKDSEKNKESRKIKDVKIDEMEFEIKGDPTNGLLEKATSLLFIPFGSVSLDVLVSVEAAIGRYRSEIFKNKDPVIPTSISNIQSNDADSNNEMYVKFFLFVERGGVIVPQDISLSGIVQTIASKFKFHLNCDRVSYKNGVCDMIAIRDEEDWRIAKWEAKYSNKNGVIMDLYLV